jgi:hypothetical protein
LHTKATKSAYLWNAIRWPFGRPFGESYWFLTLMLLVVVVCWFVSQPCYQGPRYFEVGYATFVITTCGWLSSQGAQGLPGWKRHAKFAVSFCWSLVSFALLVLVIVFVASVFTPTYQCYNDRAKTAELVLTASLYRESVAENIKTHRSLEHANDSVVFHREGRALTGNISSNGTIVVIGEDPAALVVLKPSFEDGAVTWKCFGFPLNVMPASCRTVPLFSD